MRDLALEVVKRLADGPEYLPLPMDQLPEAARNMPPDRIVDIPLAVINYAPFEKDPEATLGLGYNFSWKQFPFETGVDRRRLSIGELGYIADPGLIGKPDVKGDGYHLYKGGRFAIDAGESLFRIYLCYTWEYQLAIDSLKPPQAGATNVWEWYVSAKFKKDAAGAYSGETLVDRVVLVDLGDAAMLEKAGQKIPPRMIQQVARWLFDGTPENRAGDAEIMRMPDARIDNPAYVEGRFGKALEIAKPSNIAVIPFDPRLTMLNKKSFTITLWFRTDRPEGGQASPKAAHSGGQVLFEQYTDPRHLISLRIRDRKTLVFESADPSGKPVEVTAESSSGNLTDGLWHLVVAGHDKETKRLFLRVDAQPLKETALAETPLVEEPIWIGGGAAGFLKGAIDEVHIYLDARPELQGGRWKD